MKHRKVFRFIATVLAAAMLMVTAYAADNYQSKDLPVGSSSEVLMVGQIEPTVMSVTVPSYVPFHISRSIGGDNKVISPRITISSHSGVPVNVNVAYTSVDLSNLAGTSWSNSGNVGSNQIAIGFQTETTVNQMPTSLSQTKWLAANSWQNLNIATLTPYGSSATYVVGTLGSSVPENSTFTVTPLLIVSQA